MNIKIEKTRDAFDACVCCNKRNYEKNLAENGEIEIKYNTCTLFDVRINCMVSTLCPDCLAKLIGKATVALASDK